MDLLDALMAHLVKEAGARSASSAGKSASSAGSGAPYAPKKGRPVARLLSPPPPKGSDEELVRALLGTLLSRCIEPELQAASEPEEDGGSVQSEESSASTPPPFAELEQTAADAHDEMLKARHTVGAMSARADGLLKLAWAADEKAAEARRLAAIAGAKAHSAERLAADANAKADEAQRAFTAATADFCNKSAAASHKVEALETAKETAKAQANVGRSDSESTCTDGASACSDDSLEHALHAMVMLGAPAPFRAKSRAVLAKRTRGKKGGK